MLQLTKVTVNASTRKKLQKMDCLLFAMLSLSNDSVYVDWRVPSAKRGGEP